MQVAFSKKFIKRLAKIPAPIREKYYGRLVLFRGNRQHPLLNDHALTGEWAGHRSINVTGDFRAIYREFGNGTYKFEAIDTHHNLYGT